MDQTTRRQKLFELFNEIGIIQQLAGSEFNRRMPEGLHSSHFSVINHLIRLGDGRTPLRIAKAFQVSKPTMTHTLNTLVARGFVEVRANPKDGRSKLVYLTAAGRDFHRRAIAALTPALDELDKHLDTKKLTPLLPKLRALREYLDNSRSD